jgi:sodium-dependent dicarboxylate transporter 2/3/5
MIPATISASCAFMLPVATIPNAVVFGTGEITIRRMAKEGLVLNLIGAVVVTAVCYFLLR